MWPLAIVTGIVCDALIVLLARYFSRTRRLVLSNLTGLMQLPVVAASIAVAVGLAGHGAAWTLAWLAIGAIGILLAGQVAFLACYAVYRLYRAWGNPNRDRPGRDGRDGGAHDARAN